MIAISMGLSESLSKAKPQSPLLSRLGKRDLILGVVLIFLPLIMVGVFEVPIPSGVYVVALGLGVFLFIRTWSRELNWAILARRFLK